MKWHHIVIIKFYRCFMFGSDMNYQIKENVGILVDGISKQFFFGGGLFWMLLQLLHKISAHQSIQIFWTSDQLVRKRCASWDLNLLQSQLFSKHFKVFMMKTNEILLKYAIIHTFCHYFSCFVIDLKALTAVQISCCVHNRILAY